MWHIEEIISQKFKGDCRPLESVWNSSPRVSEESACNIAFKIIYILYIYYMHIKFPPYLSLHVLQQSARRATRIFIKELWWSIQIDLATPKHHHSRGAPRRRRRHGDKCGVNIAPKRCFRIVNITPSYAALPLGMCVNGNYIYKRVLHRYINAISRAHKPLSVLVNPCRAKLPYRSGELTNSPCGLVAVVDGCLGHVCTLCRNSSLRHFYHLRDALRRTPKDIARTMYQHVRCFTNIYVYIQVRYRIK